MPSSLYTLDELLQRIVTHEQQQPEVSHDGRVKPLTLRALRHYLDMKWVEPVQKSGRSLQFDDESFHTALRIRTSLRQGISPSVIHPLLTSSSGSSPSIPSVSTRSAPSLAKSPSGLSPASPAGTPVITSSSLTQATSTSLYQEQKQRQLHKQLWVQDQLATYQSSTPSANGHCENSLASASSSVALRSLIAASTTLPRAIDPSPPPWESWGTSPSTPSSLPAACGAEPVTPPLDSPIHLQVSTPQGLVHIQYDGPREGLSPESLTEAFQTALHQLMTSRPVHSPSTRKPAP